MIADWLSERLKLLSPKELGELARKVDVDSQTLKTIRDKKHSPRLETVEALVEALGCRLLVLESGKEKLQETRLLYIEREGTENVIGTFVMDTNHG